jgi:hypothetical protein
MTYTTKAGGNPSSYSLIQEASFEPWFLSAFNSLHSLNLAQHPTAQPDIFFLALFGSVRLFV